MDFKHKIEDLLLLTKSHWQTLIPSCFSCSINSIYSPLPPFINSLKNFPDGSLGKESACSAGNTGDGGSIPGLGRSPKEGNSCSLQYFLPEKSLGQRSLMSYSRWSQRVRHVWVTMHNKAPQSPFSSFLFKVYCPDQEHQQHPRVC